MTDTKQFPLGDILSIVAGRIVVPQKQGDREVPRGITEFILFMKGENFSGHSIACRDECRMSLRTLLPQLHTPTMGRAIATLGRKLSHITDYAAREEIKRVWLSRQISKYGEALLVEPIA